MDAHEKEISIPDDIMYAAGRVVAELCGETRALLMGEVEALALPIAHALFLERKRCFKRLEAAKHRFREHGRKAQLGSGIETIGGTDAPADMYWYTVVPLS